MDEVLKNMGQELRNARKERNMTQQQLADYTNHGLRHIQRIELGKVNPTFEMLYVLVHELGISADPLFFPDMADSEKEMRHIQAKLEIAKGPCIIDTEAFPMGDIYEQHKAGIFICPGRYLLFVFLTAALCHRVLPVRV